MSDQHCIACKNPLVITLPSSSDDEDYSTSSNNIQESSVPDDVHLPCNCHYHWQCLLDSKPYSVTSCPNCSSPLASQDPITGKEVLHVSLHNEGGMQENLDILPLLQEENYLKAYPEERKSRAFLEFAQQGDLEAVLELVLGSLESDNEDEEEDDDGDEMNDEDGTVEVPQQNLDSILRYADPLSDGSTALHIAVGRLAGQDVDQSRNQQIIWLILLLASNLEPERFPEDVKTAGEQLGLKRSDQPGLLDVRNIKDGNGRTSYEIALENGLQGGGAFDIEVLLAG